MLFGIAQLRWSSNVGGPSDRIPYPGYHKTMGELQRNRGGWSPTATSWYWVVTLALLVFGLVGIFSVGAPFLLVGLALLVLAPWREQPLVLWPGIAAVSGFVVVFVLVAPLGCTKSISLRGVPGDQSVSTGRTECGNALGIDYSGGPNYEPGYTAPLAGGTAGALAAGIGTWLTISLRKARSP